MMQSNPLFSLMVIAIVAPLVMAVAVLLVPARVRGAKEACTIIATLINLIAAIKLFPQTFVSAQASGAFVFSFSLRLYHFSAFIILAAAGFGFLLALYSSIFMRTAGRAKQFYAYFLITLAFTNGAVLADNLLLMLFFWEGLLLVLFGMIAVGGANSFRAATKALVIAGVADLCLMIGVALTGQCAGTLVISAIHLPLGGSANLAFILLMIGAIAKAGSMPFHTWIPDAAVAAPMPFMALVPAALEKLLGIYFLARICLDLFILTPQSGMSTLLMVVGSVTILLAVMMALVQKNYKRLLSYHAISQVGYMILGIGTALPVGIIGGLFHMINHAIYKSGLFLSAGVVERQAGTTDLEKLGGLGRKMPLTFICFLITAASISGVPPFNGFFSKELVYDAALARNFIFYIAATLGSFFTAASFLKLGHAAFLGKLTEHNKKVKEAPLLMLVPLLVLAGFCIFFGLYNRVPLTHLIAPILGHAGLEHHGLNIKLVVVTVVVICAAIVNHIFGVKMSGSALGAVDHIHHTPMLRAIYDKAQKGFFDPYEIGLKIVGSFAHLLFRFDRAIDWVYETFTVNLVGRGAQLMKRLHSGNYATYLFWVLVGMGFIVVFLGRSL